VKLGIGLLAEEFPPAASCVRDGGGAGKRGAEEFPPAAFAFG